MGTYSTTEKGQTDKQKTRTCSRRENQSLNLNQISKNGKQEEIKRQQEIQRQKELENKSSKKLKAKQQQELARQEALEKQKQAEEAKVKTSR